MTAQTFGWYPTNFWDLEFGPYVARCTKIENPPNSLLLILSTALFILKADALKNFETISISQISY